MEKREGNGDAPSTGQPAAVPPATTEGQTATATQAATGTQPGILDGIKNFFMGKEQPKQGGRRKSKKSKKAKKAKRTKKSRTNKARK